jgi:gentisate 1,2-dioxygenase
MTPLSPALRGQSAITPSLHTGLQLILPGDFNITPSRTWHNYGHNGSAVSVEPVGWLAGRAGHSDAVLRCQHAAGAA